MDPPKDLLYVVFPACTSRVKSHNPQKDKDKDRGVITDVNPLTSYRMDHHVSGEVMLESSASQALMKSQSLLHRLGLNAVTKTGKWTGHMKIGKQTWDTPDEENYVSASGMFFSLEASKKHHSSPK